MDHFAGLDVSVKETSVCIVDDTGKIVREMKVASRCSVDVAHGLALLFGIGARKAVRAYVHFSNRPFRVKHFQTIRRCSVDVASLIGRSGSSTFRLSAGKAAAKIAPPHPRIP
jgi:hypothetical protein